MNTLDPILYSQVARFFPAQANVEAPAPDADLFEAGILDSLAFIDLVVFLEQEFGLRISPDELEPENFRSITRIADFVAAHTGVKHAASPSAVPSQAA
jgi:methoxymalonate biosynthesis acyl carrier protein